MDQQKKQKKKQYALEARGRNGEFIPRRVFILKDGDYAAISIASNRLGNREPLELYGDRKALTDVMRRIYSALTREAKAGELIKTTLHIPPGIPKVSEPEKYGMRFVRTKSKSKTNP